MSTEDQGPIVLVLGADDNYARPLAVTLYSALVNLDRRWSVEVYLIDGGIQPSNKERIDQIASRAHCSIALHWKAIDASLFSCLPRVTGKVSNDTVHLNEAAYLRLFIPDLVPERHPKAIYLDSDLIVRSSLSDMWTMSFNGKAILAVQDYWIPYVSCDLGIEKYGELGLPARAEYFNSGVFAVDLPHWRAQSIKQKVADYLVAHEASQHFYDQEGLNVVLADAWRPLPLSWNVPHIVDAPQWNARLDRMPDSPFKRKMRRWMPTLPQHAHIIHYASGSKPWKSSSHYRLQHLWYKYLWASGWLSREERIRSQILFYSRYYPREVFRRGTNCTRPYRHKLANRLPSGFADALRR